MAMARTHYSLDRESKSTTIDLILRRKRRKARCDEEDSWSICMAPRLSMTIEWLYSLRYVTASQEPYFEEIWFQHFALNIWLGPSNDRNNVLTLFLWPELEILENLPMVLGHSRCKLASRLDRYQQA